MHGTISGYQRGCRCDDCRAVKRDYMRDYKARQRPINDTTIPSRPPHPLDVTRPDWVAHAACRGLTELFFAERGDNAAVRSAKNVCGSCPVQIDCRQYGADNGEKHGVWGGCSPDQLRQHRSRRIVS